MGGVCHLVLFCVPSPSLSSTKEAQVIACSEKPFICGALPPRTNWQRSIIVLRWVKKRNPYPICKSFQIWKARWVSVSVSLNLIYKGRILNMAEKIHTIICANILKSHWIYPFNIAHLHASKEPEFYLWSQAPLSQLIHSSAKRESVTCSHSRTSFLHRLSISESILHQSALKQDAACPSLITSSSLLCHHPFSSIHFYHADLWDNSKPKERRRPNRRLKSYLCAPLRSSYRAAPLFSPPLVTARLQHVRSGRITSWAFEVFRRWWFSRSTEAHTDPCVGTANYRLNSNVTAVVICIVIKSEWSSPDGRGFHFWQYGSGILETGGLFEPSGECDKMKGDSESSSLRFIFTLAWENEKKMMSLFKSLLLSVVVVEPNIWNTSMHFHPLNGAHRYCQTFILVPLKISDGLRRISPLKNW